MDLKKAYLQALEAGDTEEAEKILAAGEAQANPRVYNASDYDEALASGNKYLANVIQSLMSRPLERQAQEDPYGKLMLDLHDAPWYKRALVGAGHRSDQLWSGLKDANNVLDTMLLPPGAAEAPAAHRIEAQIDDDATAKYRTDIEKNAGIAGILGEFAPYYASGTTLGPIMSEAMSGLISGGKWLARGGPFIKQSALHATQKSLVPGVPMQERLANILGMTATGAIEGGVDSERHALTSGGQGLIGGIAGEIARPYLSRQTSNATDADKRMMKWLEDNYGYEFTPGQKTHIKSLETYDAGLRINAKTQDLMRQFDLNNDRRIDNMIADVFGMPRPKNGFTTDDFAALDAKLNEGFAAIRKNTYGEFTPEDLHKIDMLTRDIHNSSTDPAVKDLAERWRRQIRGMSGPGGGLTATPVSEETYKKTMENLQGVLKRLEEKNKNLQAQALGFAKSPRVIEYRNKAYNAERLYNNYITGKLRFEDLPEGQAFWKQENEALNSWENAINTGAAPDVISKLATKAREAQEAHATARKLFLDELRDPNIANSPRAVQLAQQHDAATKTLNEYLARAPKVDTKILEQQNKFANTQVNKIAELLGFNESQVNAKFLTPAHLERIDHHLTKLKNFGNTPSKYSHLYPESFYEDIMTALQPIRANMNPVNEAGNTVIKGDVVDDLGKEINKTLRDYYNQDKGVYAKMLQPYQDYLRNATKWQEGMDPAEIEHLNQIKKQYAMRNLAMDNRMVNADMQTDMTAIRKWLEGDSHELGMALAGKTAGEGKPAVPEKEILQHLAYLEAYKKQMARTVQTNMGTYAVPADTLHTYGTVQPPLSSLLKTQLYLRGFGPIPAGWPAATGYLNMRERGPLSVQPWFHASEQTQDFGGRTYRNALRLYDKSQKLYHDTFGE